MEIRNRDCPRREVSRVGLKDTYEMSQDEAEKIYNLDTTGSGESAGSQTQNY